MIQVILSNSKHPEYGQATIPFPLAQDQYEDCVELLEKLGIGDAVERDCKVEEIQGGLPILKRLEKVAINIDELDYLAKRLDSFDSIEEAQFQAMAVKLGTFDMTELINLTFCCQQATVITDFSDLDAVGRHHIMSINGGCAPSELAQTDLRMTALKLILSKEGTVTPYGVVYDNGMKLEQVYDGRHLPGYHYGEDLLAVGISSRAKPETTSEITWLYLPCSELQIERGRLGKFMLEVAEDKTRILPIGRFKGTKDEFDFLGFTFFNARTREGKYRLGIRTSKKKLKAKRQAAKAWLRTRMVRPIPETMMRVAAIIRGHCNYYGVNGNLRSLYKFHDYMKQMTHKMLNRRSQKGYVTNEKFQRVWDYYVAPPKLTKDIWQWIPKTV